MSVKTVKQILQDKADRIMEGVAAWTAFYRENPHRFAKDVLNVNLKTFQKILLYAMMHNNYFMYLAARGQGKTFLIALFCVIRCILYPGTKIVVAAGVKGQAAEVIAKIKDELCKSYQWGSSNLCNEIKDIKHGQNDAYCEFKNASWIKVVTSNDNARGKRANILIVDEFRVVDLSVINTVLKRFLSSPRHPGYLDKPKYKHLLERNKEIYASSCWYSSHWMMKKIKSYFSSMMTGKEYFICSLPYQISIKENLLQREQIEDEMSEEDFNHITFSMEMESLMYSDTDGSFFTYNDLSNIRKISNVFYPLDVYQNRKIAIPKLVFGEERILSVDVALMASGKNRNNDAACLSINSAIPTTNTDFMSNFVYMETHEGLTTDELGIIVMRTFYEYKCTQLCLDCQGNGIGVYDFIIKDQFDSQTGKTYKALSCCNDQLMEERCKVKDANRVVWSVKASASFYNEVCVLLRTGIQNKKISLPKQEIEGEDFLRKQIKGYNKLTPREQVMFKISYTQTTYAINELVNLEYEFKNGNLRVFEKSGMRKDRYSSLAYNYWCIMQISRKRKPTINSSEIASELASISRSSSKKYSMFG